ncbi:MAG: thioredoxin family protein [Ignavibacteriaceae bacterium]
MLMKILFLSFAAVGLMLGGPNFYALTSQQNNIALVMKNLSSDSGSTDNKQNNIVKDSYSGMPMLIGKCSREAFKDTSFNWWWMSESNFYDVDSASLKEIKNDLKDVNIEIVMGTWCSDSRREVPRFFKILDAVNYPSNKVGIICVDEDKKTQSNELDGLKIELVPTIIFYKDGNELGRIIESPHDTLEKDMIKILTAHS